MSYNRLRDLVSSNYCDLICTQWALKLGRNIDPAVDRYETLRAKLVDSRDFRAQLDKAAGEMLAAYKATVIESDKITIPSLPADSSNLERFRRGVEAHYASLPEANRTPVTSGINVIDQLLTGRTMRLVGTRAGVGRFFSVKDSFLKHLVLLVVPRDGRMLFATFLSEVESRFWLKPEQTTTRDLLGDKLYRMGLLERYSDSGEAQYVLPVVQA
jgi:DNA phosphorothioation-dependent restriction protein DptG